MHHMFSYLESNELISDNSKSLIYSNNILRGLVKKYANTLIWLVSNCTSRCCIVLFKEGLLLVLNNSKLNFNWTVLTGNPSNWLVGFDWFVCQKQRIGTLRICCYNKVQTCCGAYFQTLLGVKYKQPRLF